MAKSTTKLTIEEMIILTLFDQPELNVHKIGRIIHKPGTSVSGNMTKLRHKNLVMRRPMKTWALTEQGRSKMGELMAKLDGDDSVVEPAPSPEFKFFGGDSVEPEFGKRFPVRVNNVDPEQVEAVKDFVEPEEPVEPGDNTVNGVQGLYPRPRFDDEDQDPIDWQREYIKLTHELVRAFARTP